MTAIEPPVPTWLTAAWDIHIAKTAACWCSVCESYLVPVEGAVCPICSDSASFEATA